MLWGWVRAYGRHLPVIRRVRYALLLAALWAVMVVSDPQIARADEASPVALDAYRLGVFPYLPVLMIDRIYGPVAAQLSEDLGRPVLLKTKPRFVQFVEEMAKQTYDIILVHPFFYVEAHDKYHYVPLARLEEPLTGVVVVRQDDPIEALADLRGKTIGLPPALAAVSALIRGALIDAGLVPGSDVVLEHYRSKHSCLQAVAIGRTAACGVPRFALAQFDPDNRLGLRPMFETDAINNFLFAVHARVPQADQINICKSILAWPYTAKGRSILAGGAWSRFVLAQDEDYDEVRRQMARLQQYAKR